jgi:hypothetical protein
MNRGRGLPAPRVLFHTRPYGLEWQENRERGTVAKKKQEKFSAAKAVKANARERVGQPKPAHAIDDKPRTGRQAKHKPKLEEVLQHEE